MTQIMDENMSSDAYITLAILALTFLLLVKTKIPAPAIFLGALTGALTFRLAPVPELLKGFSNPGMLTVGILFMVAAGMYSTGAITILMEKLVGIPQSNVSARMRILPPIAVGSAFLNNTPLVAMMIPVIRDLCKNGNLSAKHLYIPLSFASILGGICTVIGTSTNLVIAGLVLSAVDSGMAIPGLRPVQMFDPAWVGLPLAVAGIAFMIFFSRWLLPDEKKTGAEKTSRRCYSAEFVVSKNSRVLGKTLAESGLGNSPGMELISVNRKGGEMDILPSLVLEEGDLLCFSAQVDALVELWRSNVLRPHLSLFPEKTDRSAHSLVRVVVSQNSPAIGRKIGSLPMNQSPYRFKIVAVSRDGECLHEPLADVQIEPGDSAVLEVDDSFFYQSQLEKDFILTKALTGYHLQRTDRALEAGLITLAMIIAAASGWMDMLNAALLATGAMLVTKCLSFRIAARSMEWGTLTVIACAIGLESAVTHSGLAGQIASLLASLGGNSPWLALAVIFAGCSFMTNIITNNAAAAFMFPIALSTAQQLHVNFMPFAIVLMISASCAFVTPTGYQTNMMVWIPGGYAFSDFAKIGMVMTLITAIITIGLTPLVFPF